MFSTLCLTFENIFTTKTKADKLSAILKYYHQEASQTQFVPYDCLRLILPKFDKARSSYGLKDNSLARKYIESLCIAKNSIEAQRLLNFKAVKGTCDLPQAIFFITQNRCHGSHEFSLNEVNALLDSIQSGCDNHNENVNNFIDKMTREMPPFQQKWICRLILKELHLGISEKSILVSIDSNAEAAFSMCSDLKKISENIGNLTSLCGDISLGRVFKPMLADRVSDMRNIESLMKNKPFFVETKYDGERMQIHKKGEQYWYFSRGSLEYSNKYGASKSCGTLTPHIHDNIVADNCILDGEIIVFDRLNNVLITKAQGVDARNLHEVHDPKLLPCFVAYDIVLYDGESLTMTPFSERRKILQQVIKEKVGYIYVSKQSLCTTNQEVLKELNEVIENGDEGLVLKVPSSIYSPDQRVDGGWFKIKTDYLELMNDTVDVVILGGYHGKYTGSGKISHFLCGINIGEGKYSSFCKVSSGLTKDDLTQKISKLEPYWVPFDKQKLPSGVILSSSCREKPAVVIDPCNSLVLEIRGAELIGTNFFALPITIRFPRVVRVRDDKTPLDCTKFTELENMRVLNKRGVSKVASKEAISSPKKKSRYINSGPSSAAFVKIDIKSEALKDEEYCVLSSSDDVTKLEAERFLKEHSGLTVSTPVSGCTILCGRRSVSVQNVIKQDKHLVLDISWIKLFTNQVNPCPPYLIVHCPSELKEKVFAPFDRFGDSYTVPITAGDLGLLLKQLPSLPSTQSYTVNQEAILDLKKKYKQFNSFWRFSLKEMVIFTSKSLSPVISVAEHCGARVTGDANRLDITHIVEDTDNGNGLNRDGVTYINKKEVLELIKPHISEESYTVLNN